jgi:hypothetical protein
MQTVEDVTDFVDPTGPASFIGAIQKISLGLCSEHWLIKFGRDLYEFESVFPVGYLLEGFGFPSVDLANHASDGVWIIVLKLDGCSLLFLLYGVVTNDLQNRILVFV